MTLKSLFQNIDKETEWGQFVEFPPYPSNKQIIAAKFLLRDSIKMTEQKMNKKARNLRWIVRDIEKDDDGREIGVVGYCVEMV